MGGRRGLGLRKKKKEARKQKRETHYSNAPDTDTSHIETILTVPPPSGDERQYAGAGMDGHDREISTGCGGEGPSLCLAKYLSTQNEG